MSVIDLDEQTKSFTTTVASGTDMLNEEIEDNENEEEEEVEEETHAKGEVFTI